MKNFVQEGDVFVVAAPATTASGDYVRVGGVAGVAEADAASGANVPLVREGVFTLPKATGAVWALGDALYWDATAKKFTTVSTGNVPAGIAGAAQLTGDTTGLVIISEPTHGHRVVFGQATTVAASDTIVTGLTKVLSVVANLEDAPVIGCDRATAAMGDQAGTPAAGSILIKTWKPTASGDATPIAATTFTKKVNWIAIGF